MARKKLVFLSLVGLILTGCGSPPPTAFEGQYFGIINIGITNFFSRRKPKCGGEQFIQASVYQDRFELSVWHYRIHGMVAPDHSLVGTWDGDNQDGQPTHIVFKGHISRPFAGSTFSGIVHDGYCDPFVELIPSKAFWETQDQKAS